MKVLLDLERFLSLCLPIRLKSDSAGQLSLPGMEPGRILVRNLTLKQHFR
jgi:hypothetical protein